MYAPDAIIEWNEEKGYMDLYLQHAFMEMQTEISSPYYTVERGAKRYELKNHLEMYKA